MTKISTPISPLQTSSVPLGHAAAPTSDDKAVMHGNTFLKFLRQPPRMKYVTTHTVPLSSYVYQTSTDRWKWMEEQLDRK